MKRQTKHLLWAITVGLSFLIVVGVFWFLSQPAKQLGDRGSVASSSTNESSNVIMYSKSEIYDSILAWNVELNGGADAKVIANQLSKLPSPILALSEVRPDAVETLKSVCSLHTPILGSTGGSIRLLFLVDTSRFDIVDSFELGDYGGHQMNNGNHRSPLVVRLRNRQSGFTFLVVNNHLARGRAELRQSQARALRDWARDQTEPIICVGDFNMDYSFIDKQGNRAFVEMLRDNIWKWIKPNEWIDTNWADRNNDGVDDYPNSMLDFVFVANGFKDRYVICEVLVREGDFPDDKTTSDHRPVAVLFGNMRPQ